MAQALLSCHPFSWGEPHHFCKLALRLGLFSWLRVGPLGWDYSHSPDVLSSSLPSLQRARYLAKVNFRALDKRCPTVQNKEQAWHLTAESPAQDTGCSSCRLARELCIESWQTKKLLFPLFFPLYTEKVYDLLLLHSFYSPEGAYLKGISALIHSQE